MAVVSAKGENDVAAFGAPPSQAAGLTRFAITKLADDYSIGLMLRLSILKDDSMIAVCEDADHTLMKILHCVCPQQAPLVCRRGHHSRRCKFHA